MAKFEASLLDARKSGWSRIGAFDPGERSHCLDLLGFQHHGNMESVMGEAIVSG